jgi:hypothetical protein
LDFVDVEVGVDAGKALERAFSRARVLAWKRGPDWV